MLDVVREVLGKQFDERTRRWGNAPLGDIKGVTLTKKHYLPQIASKRAVAKVRLTLRKEHGLDFSEDGTLATADPMKRLLAVPQQHQKLQPWFNASPPFETATRNHRGWFL